jgi:hypothetical protein
VVVNNWYSEPGPPPFPFKSTEIFLPTTHLAHCVYLFGKMPTHKFPYPEGVMPMRMSNVHQLVTMEELHEEFHRHGAFYVLCAFERVVDRMYDMEPYVQFCSRRRAIRATSSSRRWCFLLQSCHRFTPALPHPMSRPWHTSTMTHQPVNGSKLVPHRHPQASPCRPPLL